MQPKEIAAALGDRDGEVRQRALESLGPASGDEVAKAIRKGFKRGDEQGNANRLTALVKIEGEGALDVLQAVLEDTTTVDGIYSNLRNTALELIHAHFLGNRSLEKSLWKALEIDEYMDVPLFCEIVTPFDAERALSLLIPRAEQGFPPALQALAKNAGARQKLLEIIDAALKKGGDEADRFIEALGAEAGAPDIAPKIIALAEVSPAAALIAAHDDRAFARRLAEKMSSKDYRWQHAGCQAVARLPPAEIFERISPLLEAADRAKPKALYRLDMVAQAIASLDDPRWLDRLRSRLEVEESPKVREMLVALLGRVGPKAIDAICSAPRDDKDTRVIAAMLDTIMTLKGKPAVIERVRAAAADAGPKGRRAKALREALSFLEA